MQYQRGLRATVRFGDVLAVGAQRLIETSTFTSTLTTLTTLTTDIYNPHTSTSRPPSLESSPTMEDPAPLLNSPPSYSFMTSLFNPSLPVLVAAAFVIFLTPLFLHLFVFNSRAATNLPTFLLVGPAGGGKTSLMTAVRPPVLRRASPTSQY